jgi:hypothetical protein
VHALRGLLDDGPELPQCREVEVDGAVADVAAAEVRDERVTEAVQQGTAEQDRDAARPGVHVDLVDVGSLHIGRIEDQLAVLGAVGDPHAVQLEQPADHLDVADARHVVEMAAAVAEQRRDHRLGDEVLRPAYAHLTPQRSGAVHTQHVT